MMSARACYLADREHFLDWGRPITFDRYVAAEHGPVPYAVRNMLVAAASMNQGRDEARAAMPQDDAAELSRAVTVELGAGTSGERSKVFANTAAPATPHLSATDVECLEAAIEIMRNNRFASLVDTSHKDEAWREARTRANDGIANINVLLWADPRDRAAYETQLVIYRPISDDFPSSLQSGAGSSHTASSRRS